MNQKLTDPLTEPGRVAFAGDWHGDIAWACQMIWLAAEQEAKAILHTGDFGYRFTAHFLTRLHEALMFVGIPLLFVDGNHDDHQWLARQKLSVNGLRPLGDWMWHIPRGLRWTWSGLRFLGLGGAHSVDATFRQRGGLMWQPQERITAKQAQLVREGGPADVMLSHDCPTGVNIPGLHPEDFPAFEIQRGEQHRKLLWKVTDVVRPKAIVHGHYHSAYRVHADIGYGPVEVVGLAENGTSFAKNMHIVDLPRWAAVLNAAVASG